MKEYYRGVFTNEFLSLLFVLIVLIPVISTHFFFIFLYYLFLLSYQFSLYNRTKGTQERHVRNTTYRVNNWNAGLVFFFFFVEGCLWNVWVIILNWSAYYTYISMGFGFELDWTGFHFICFRFFLVVYAGSLLIGIH